ncbi:DUF6207 family protein [Streptomyces goshikiensis]|uniref:DUF6207 family protein n=1 Tax=Streptomyces goshikiensis TaxID=1942 RepID=UPI0037AE88CF
MKPIDEQHTAEPGLVVLDITGGDEDTVRAVMTAMEERENAARRLQGSGPASRSSSSRRSTIAGPQPGGRPPTTHFSRRHETHLQTHIRPDRRAMPERCWYSSRSVKCRRRDLSCSGAAGSAPP